MAGVGVLAPEQSVTSPDGQAEPGAELDRGVGATEAELSIQVEWRRSVARKAVIDIRDHTTEAGGADTHRHDRTTGGRLKEADPAIIGNDSRQILSTPVTWLDIEIFNVSAGQGQEVAYWRYHRGTVQTLQ